MLETLKQLCSLHGPSGDEGPVRRFIIETLKPHVDSLETDSMGNLLVFKKGAITPSKRLMLAAHMDEVGFIIKSITDDGYLKFGCVGGIETAVLMGRRVKIGEKGVHGVIGIKAVHLTSAAERKSLPKVEDLYMDIGASSQKEAAARVSVGDYGVFDSRIVAFGDGLLKAKALDDRIGCALLVQLLQKPLPCDCYVAFTVQEEVGLRGATVAAYTLKPDLCLVLEGTTAADLPETDGHKQVCHLRRGPVIPFMDRGTIYSRRLFDLLRATAEKEQIPWQTKELVAGGTDAGKIHLSRGGVETAALSLALRYIHSPSSVCALSDVYQMEQLLGAFLKEIANEAI